MAEASVEAVADIAAPGGYTVRGVSRDDFDAILALCNAADLVDWGDLDINAEIIQDDWRLPGMDLERNAWLVEDAAGDAVAYSWVHVLGELPAFGWGVVHPDHRGRGIGGFVVRLRERRAAELLADRAATQRGVQMWIAHPDHAGHELLTQQGYRAVRHFYDMQIRLASTVAEPAPVDGFTIRAYRKGPDDRAVHAAVEEAFEDHWQHHPWTFEEWSQRRFTDSFDPTLWWVAMEGEEVAGALLGGTEDGVGWVNTLGVRRPWRRRGLGEALLRVAFAEFARRGIHDVRLGVDASNPTGATRLYDRVGMHVHRRFDVYQKEL